MGLFFGSDGSIFECYYRVFAMVKTLGKTNSYPNKPFAFFIPVLARPLSRSRIPEKVKKQLESALNPSERVARFQKIQSTLVVFTVGNAQHFHGA